MAATGYRLAGMIRMGHEADTSGLAQVRLGANASGHRMLPVHRAGCRAAGDACSPGSPALAPLPPLSPCSHSPGRDQRSCSGCCP
jgi:hypothetical protein